MAMSLKQEIETWVQALSQYDNSEFEESLKTFDNIADTSKILFNCGVIHATLGEHDKAVECYQRAVRLDQYLAVAYFQQGVSNFLVGDFEEALANFNDTLLYLRGNTFIDYDQLGLKFKLYSCEVLFNRGLCYVYLQQIDAGMDDLIYASKEKAIPDHDVIDEAIKERADGYTVFSIPVGVIYRPNSSKVKNLKTKDYLGKARLVASTEKTGTHAGLAGSESKRAQAPVVQDDRAPESISYAATNLVRADLVSRSRQPSDPPVGRNMFPPTPPPEEQSRPSVSSSRSYQQPSNPSPMTARAGSVRDGMPAAYASSSSSTRLPPPLEDDTVSSSSTATVSSSSFSSSSSSKARVPAPLTIVAHPSPPRGPPPLVSSPESIVKSERPRPGNLRTASEPRGPSSKHGNARPCDLERNATTNLPYMHSAPSRGRLFGETILHPSSPGHEADIDEAPEEIFNLYHANPAAAAAAAATANPYASPRQDVVPRPRRRSRSRGPQRASTGAYPSETETMHSARSSVDDFEMLSPVAGTAAVVAGAPPSANPNPVHRRGNSGRRPPLHTNQSFSSTQSHATTVSFTPSHSFSYSHSSNHLPHPGISTIRVKMHFRDETRYLMIHNGIMYDEFVDKVREKLGLKCAVKVKVRDEGDFVTLGDKDDWDLAVQGARGEAKGKGEDMGRLEVWIHEMI